MLSKNCVKYFGPVFLDFMDPLIKFPFLSKTNPSGFLTGVALKLLINS